MLGAMACLIPPEPRQSRLAPLIPPLPRAALPLPLSPQPTKQHPCCAPMPPVPQVIVASLAQIAGSRQVAVTVTNSEFLNNRLNVTGAVAVQYTADVSLKLLGSGTWWRRNRGSLRRAEMGGGGA